MSEKKTDLPQARDFPEARPARHRWPSIVWLVPLLAAGIAGWLGYKNMRQSGPMITVRFKEGKGLLAGQTLVRYRGVRIGEVEAIHLSPDARWVEVQARLDKSATPLASQGAQFWIVRADVTAGTMRGLDTIVGGPYIQIQPGRGLEQKTFTGIEEGPISVPEDDGLDVTLSWPRLGGLGPGAPVYYRGIEVGTVQDFHLGNHATNIIIHAHIKAQFAPLVRDNSKFWNAGGIKAKIGFLGVTVSAETLKSLLVGGIAFATPEPPGPPASPEKIFPLEEKAPAKWLEWAPAIELGPQRQ